MAETEAERPVGLTEDVGWEIGVFESWDAVGLQASVDRMHKEGQPIPANISQMLANGATSFYKTEGGSQFYYDLVGGEYKPVPERPGVMVLKSVKERTGVIKQNPGASLIDLGDGVACLEFHSKMNSIGGDTIQNFLITILVGLICGTYSSIFIAAQLLVSWEEGDLPGFRPGAHEEAEATA